MAKRKRTYSDDTLAELPVDYSFTDNAYTDVLTEELPVASAPQSASAPEPELSEAEGEDRYLDEIEEFLMEEMVEREAEERIDRMAEGIRIHIHTEDFNTLDHQKMEESKPLRETPEDIIAPDFDLGDDGWQPQEPPRPDNRLYWAIASTLGLILLALIYIVTH